MLDPPELDLSNGPRELLRSASQPVSVEISNSEPIRIPETVQGKSVANLISALELCWLMLEGATPNYNSNSVPVGSRIARVLASDKDTGDNSKIFYRIVSENSNPVGGKFAYLSDKQVSVLYLTIVFFTVNVT